eukprot:864968_1
MAVGASGHGVCFEDVLGSRSALLLFVEHLESEFSVENILFLVEVAKFREYYLSIILEKQKYQLLLKSGVDLKSLKRKLRRLASSDQQPASPSSHLPNGDNNNKSTSKSGKGS